MKNIALYGAGWVHNMGNSFIQIGSKLALEKAVPEANVHIVDGNPFELPTPAGMKVLSKFGGLPGLGLLRKFEEHHHNNAHEKEVKLADLADIDAVVLSGVWLSTKYLVAHKKNFLALKERGIPLIFSGAGGTHYNQQEFDEVTELIQEIEPFAIISRDQKVCDAYTGVIPHIYAGMDVGFFVGESFSRPLPMAKKSTVYCFDRSAIPAELDVSDDAVVTHHAEVGLQYDTFDRGKVFVSEMAEDYLNLYANCDTVYSDRVHACVAALSFGNKARLIDKTPRAHLFDVLQAGSVREEVTQLSPEILEAKKAEHVDILSKVFEAVG